MSDIKMYPQYKNLGTISLDEFPKFLLEDFPYLYEQYRENKENYPLYRISLDMTVPYNDYVINMCIDLNPSSGDPLYYLTVEIPFSDRFLPIKSDI